MAMKEIMTWHVPSMDDPADIFTKVVPGGENSKHLIGKVSHNLYKQ